MKIAALGITGGCCGQAITEALEAGHVVSALARYPDKISKSLLNHDNFKVIQGDAQDPEVVTRLIQNHDILLFALGGSPYFSWTQGFINDNPNVCENAMIAVKQAYSKASNPPGRIIAISTTGLNSKRDIPLAYIPIYKGLLHSAHKDKKLMETALGSIDGAREKIILRPTLLTDGRINPDIRYGDDAIGYSISRASVGHYIAKHCFETSLTDARQEVLLTN